VAAQTLQAALGQVLATRTVGEAAGVVVHLQRRGEFAAVVRFHLQLGLLEVVVAPGGLGAAGFQAHAEGAYHFMIGGKAAALLIVERGEFGEDAGVITKYQAMAVLTVLDVEADAFFLAQALNEVQVAFVVLHAVVALGVDVTELELVGVALDAVVLENLSDDLRHRQVLEYPLVVTVGQVGELRSQTDAVARQALAGVALLDGVDHAVHALAGGAEGQVGGLVDQRVEVEAGVLANQFDIEAVGLVERFAPLEAQNLQVVFDSGNG